MDPALVLSFFAAAIMLALAPGPDILFVLAQGMSQGKRAGGITALGLATGCLVHTAAAALGVAVMLQASPLAFDLIRYAGAAYLLWLAFGALRAPGGSKAGKAEALPLRRLYLRGFLMNVLNPKVTLFFLAFLPQFVRPGATWPVAAQMMVLGGVFMLATVIVFGVVGVSAGRLGEWLGRRPAVELWLNRGAGLLLGGIGLSLALG